MPTSKWRVRVVRYFWWRFLLALSLYVALMSGIVSTAGLLFENGITLGESIIVVGETLLAVASVILFGKVLDKMFHKATVYASLWKDEYDEDS